MVAELTHLGQVVARQASANGDAAALYWRGSETSYGELNQSIQQLAGRLASVGQAGSRIAVLAANNPDYVTLLYAIPLAGRILVPLNTRLAAPELQYQIDKTQPELLFGDQALLENLASHNALPDKPSTVSFGASFSQWRDNGETAPLPELQGGEAAWLLFTSGTTGRPKGAVLTHRSLLAGLRSGQYGRPVKSNDRYLYPFPLFHVSAHNVLLQHLHGASVALLAAFDAEEVLDCCTRYGITTMSLAPTMINMLLEHPTFDRRALSTVQTIGYGASAISPTLLENIMQQTDAGLSQGFGMTELSGSVAFLGAEDHRHALRHKPQRLQSVGKPVPGIDIRVVDDNDQALAAGESGEILVRGAQVLQSYWRDAPATAKAIVDGWFHTGDIGRFDEDGYLYIVDRKKDMIVSGGENVASREVENALLQHPSVRQVAVVGIPSKQWGEVVCALLVLQLNKPVHEAESCEEELSTYCRSQLANYKVPKHFLFTDSLPVNASGKIDKKSVREQVTASLAGI